MTFTSASTPSLIAFLAVVLFVLAAVLLGSWARIRQVAAGIAIWLAIFCVVVSSGVLAEQPMPRVPLFFAAINLVSLAFGFSPAGKWISQNIPIRALVGFQAFRLPLELVLHSWAEQGTIPETMTWTGQNFDVVTGVVTLTVALFFGKSRSAAWIANVVGIALLLNVIRVAMMSSPLPFAWQVNPPLQLIFYLPYALIGPVCVGGALAGHVILTRALLTRRH